MPDSSVGSSATTSCWRPPSSFKGAGNSLSAPRTAVTGDRALKETLDHSVMNRRRAQSLGAACSSVAKGVTSRQTRGMNMVMVRRVRQRVDTMGVSHTS